MNVFQRFVLMRTYARRGENSWEDIVDRVWSGINYWTRETGLKDTFLGRFLLEKGYRFILERKFLPPGRGLWMMGTPYIAQRGSMALNNCGFVSTTSPRAIRWLMNALMLGVGVGFDTVGAKLYVKKPRGVVEYTIPDSREGWAKSVEMLLNAYLKGMPYPRFDYSKIRPAGVPIKGFGGVASGPEPLKRLHSEITEILNARIGRPVGVVGIVDIINAIGRCVVAGNVRRSALLALSPPDETFAKLKENKEAVIKKRWVSNITVKVRRPEQIPLFAEYFLKTGEPGLYNSTTINIYGRIGEVKPQTVRGINPCGEIALESYELCNLSEFYPANCNSIDEVIDAGILAYAYAKMVSLIPTGDQKSQRVVNKNHRIGVSVSGIHEAYAKFGKEKVIAVLKYLYAEYTRLDELMYILHGIPKSIRLTTVKPSGTLSIIAGVSAGVHYPPARYYIRRVRLGKNDKLVSILRNANVPLVEDIYSQDTYVAEFPLSATDGVPTLQDVSFMDQFKNVLELQRVWADNQISCTLTFREDEKERVIDAVMEHFDEWKTLTIMPYNTDHYPLMPLEPITYNEYRARALEIDPEIKFEGVKGVGVAYCTKEGCLL